VLALVIGYLLMVILLAALRIHGAIEWSWLWVLCPLWLPLVLTVIGFASFIIVKRME
jgi:hypothetical protein